MESNVISMEIPQMLKIRDAASQTGLAYEFIRRLCLTNKIAYVRAGKKYLINLGSLITYLNTGDGKNGKEDR